MKKILVVDDNQENLDLIVHMLATTQYEHATAKSGLEALAKMEVDNYDIVLSDLMMPQMDGIELLEKIKSSWPETEVVIITAHGSVTSAVEAIKKGAYSYILKPFEPDDLLNEVNKVSNLIDMKNENMALKEELARVKHADTFIGSTPQIKAVFELIKTVANTNATILIQGESGTGKELVANAVHNNSNRSNAPFVKVACAALSENLLESELFGHEKGSFTGAVALRKGRFEYANGGTIFLDEIGEISPTVQIKLLRVLQEREFDRVGGTKTIKTDVRIVSATNRDLAEAVKEGVFREDLFYRLNVIQIKMPPLRERVDDIPLLINYFLEKYKIEVKKNIESVSEEAVAKLKGYHWPGNIRELQNVLERAVVLAKGKTIEIEDLPDNIRSGGQKIIDMDSRNLPALKEAKQSFEKDFLEKALTINKGNISRTAEMIKLARKNLQDKIKIYEIKISTLLNKN
jgi:DNA-binding NtrC family response regulator